MAAIVALIGGFYIIEDRWNQGVEVLANFAAVQALDKRVDYNLAQDQLKDTEDSIEEICKKGPPTKHCDKLEKRKDRLEKKLEGYDEKTN